MDFPIPNKAKSLAIAIPKSNVYTPALPFKLGQKLEAKVLQVTLATHTLKLQLGNAVIDTELSSQEPLKKDFSDLKNLFSKGQNLSLIVTNLSPQAEFKIDATNIMPEQKASQQKILLQDKLDIRNSKDTTKLNLKLLTRPSDLAINNPKLASNQLTNLQIGQQLPAKIIAINSKLIQLQLFTQDKPNIQPELSTLKPGKIVSIPLNENAMLSQSYNKTNNLKANIVTGEMVLLEATKPGVKPQFSILKNNVFPELTERIVAQTIKQSLPVQQSPEVFFNQLIKDIPSLNKNINIPETLKILAKQILQNLPRQSSLSNANGLKLNINKSGIFLESLLSQNESDSEINYQEDFKANLLKFINLTKQISTAQPQTNTEILKQETVNFKLLQNNGESSVAKLVLDQLNSLPKDDSPKQSWYLELPYFRKEKAQTISLEIEKDHSKNNELDSRDWSVTINTNLPKLGKLLCKIYCLDGIVNTYFWSDSEMTTKLISSHLNHLKLQFEASGIKPGKLHTVEAIPKRGKIPVYLNSGLVDEKI